MPYDVPENRMNELVDVIGQAFSSSPDPPSDYVFELEPNAQSLKEQFFRGIAAAYPPPTLRQASTDKLEAISIWSPPGATHSEEEPELFDPAEFQSAETLKRIEELMRCIGVATEKLGSEPQWYLHVLASRPEHRGQGYTSILLRSIFARADEADLPCTLICPKHNVPVYEHFGFDVVAKTAIGDSGMFIYNMRRDPIS